MSNEKTNTYSNLKKKLEQQAAASPTPKQTTAATVEPADPSSASVTDRQERIEGFDQDALSKTTVLLVGAGAVGGEIGEGLVRKGIDELYICDEDVVDVSNLNRQKFQTEDVGENKALALIRRLAPKGTCGTALHGYPYHFQDAIARGYQFDPDVVICAPDNDAARVAVATHFLADTPVITTALNTEALGGYVFVQEPGDACFRCFRPETTGGGACPGAPATIDPTKTVAGMALFAVDSTLMPRPRRWNLSEFFLSGEIRPTPRTVDRRDDCSLCGGG
jgi:molybdopterin/thiamine biosynthesis adenylyltransferase